MQRKRKGALKWFGETEGRFLVAFEGDGCPFGKNESACSFLISFLNFGKRVASSSDNILVFAGNVEETSLIVKKYINFVCKQIKDLKGCEKAEIFRHEFIILVGLPEQHHEPCSYTPNKNDYIPQRVFNDSNYCYCGVHKADPTDKSCCLCSDHLMALIHKSVKEGKIVAGLSQFQIVLIQSNEGEVT